MNTSDHSDKTRVVPRDDQSNDGKTIYVNTHHNIQDIPIRDGRPDAGDMGRTVVINRSGAAPSPREDEPTRLVRISSLSSSSAGEPSRCSSEEGWVVGWLVAVSGPMKGKSFPLGPGQNQVGREASNRVCLPEDPGVSRRGHVVITYDPRRNRFSARPGTEGSGIADLNDDLLEIPTTLAHGDVLRLSDETSLRFIPFCDASFVW